MRRDRHQEEVLRPKSSKPVPCRWFSSTVRTTEHSSPLAQPLAKSSGSSGKRCVTSVRQAEVDTGHAPGATTEENEERSRLRKENKRLRGATEILKKAIVFFAGELDSRNR